MNMKLIVTIFIISSTYKPAANQELNSMQEDETGYSTSNIHEGQHLSEQQAQNSVDHQLGPRMLRQYDQPIKNYKNLYFQSSNDAEDSYPLQYVKNRRPVNFVQNLRHNSPSSQSFNVGYSVKFGNARPRPVVYEQPINSDIITGSPKEEVIKPESADVRREEFVLNSFLDSKRQKISGIKPKYHRPTISNLDTSQLIAQANLSPKTRKKLSELQETKFPDYESDEYLKTVNNSPWKILSPGVEIYESKSMSPVRIDQDVYDAEPNRFDHAKALGRSIGFDYTNAMTDTRESDRYSNLHNREYIGDTAYENSKNKYDKDLYLADNTQDNTKTSQYLGTRFEGSTEAFKEPILSHSNIIANSNAEVASEYSDAGLKQKNKYGTTNNVKENNYYLENYPRNTKNFGNNRVYLSKPDINEGHQQLKYTSVIHDNAQFEDLNKDLENLYKMNERNPDHIISQNGHNHKNFYSQQGLQIPVVDFSKNMVVQKYISQPNYIPRATNQMYSVKENQSEDIPTQLNDSYGNHVIYGKKYSNIYIPYNNLQASENGRLKKIRPSSRFVKEVQRHFRSPTRNRGTVRREMYR